MSRADIETLSLLEAARTLLDECRMVLPGIQALFGFQLIAVFSSGFDEKLSPALQQLHFAATALVALAIAIIMTPAALHRQKGEMTITRRFLEVSTRLLLWSMVPLAVGICLEFWLVGQALADVGGASAVSGVLFAAYVFLWFVVPRVDALQKLISR